MMGTALDGAHPAADFQPVDPRQHEVQHDQIRLIGIETLERLLAAPRLNDAVPLALERVRQKLLDGVLVVDEQNGRSARHCTRKLRRDRIIETTIALSPSGPAQPATEDAGMRRLSSQHGAVPAGLPR